MMDQLLKLNITHNDILIIGSGGSIKNSKFGTKNLPDAIKWHCSYYWDHVFNKKEIQSSKKTINLLKTSIAIPILLKKSLKDYEILVKNILKAQ